MEIIKTIILLHHKALCGHLRKHYHYGAHYINYGTIISSIHSMASVKDIFLLAFSAAVCKIYRLQIHLLSNIHSRFYSQYQTSISH